jgi:hypothetical protein
LDNTCASLADNPPGHCAHACLPAQKWHACFKRIKDLVARAIWTAGFDSEGRQDSEGTWLWDVKHQGVGRLSERGGIEAVRKYEITKAPHKVSILLVLGLHVLFLGGVRVNGFLFFASLLLIGCLFFLTLCALTHSTLSICMYARAPRSCFIFSFFSNQNHAHLFFSILYNVQKGRISRKKKHLLLSLSLSWLFLSHASYARAHFPWLFLFRTRFD